jgi:hypothetical protein
MAGDDEVPHPLSYPGASGVEVFQAGGVDLAESAAQGGWGGDLAEQVAVVTQHVDGSQGVPAVGHHDRRVDQDPSAVVIGGEVLAAKSVGQGLGQTGTISGQT